MASHHRKLIDDYATNLTALCKPYCDGAQQSNGMCLTSCFSVCPPESCKIPVLPFPPPPPLTPPPSVSPSTVANQSQPLSRLLIDSLAVLATAFFLFTCYTIYKFYAVWSSSRQRRASQRRRRPEEEDGGPDDDLLDEELGPAIDHPIWYIRTIGLQPSVINAITIVKYKSADGLVEGTDCAVCLSEFEEDETLRLLPKCSHAFHIACIDTWLTSHTNCPMCRAGIVTTAAGPLPAPHDSGRAEESQSEEAPGSDGEEVRVGIEDDEMSENGEGGDCKVDVSRLEGGVLQPVRRSVSMDSSAAAVISAAVSNALSDHNSNKQLVVKGKDSKVEDVGRRSVEVNQSLLRLVGSPSIERYMQTAGSSSIKRSASCSAKVFLSRHSSRSRS